MHQLLGLASVVALFGFAVGLTTGNPRLMWISVITALIALIATATHSSR